MSASMDAAAEEIPLGVQQNMTQHGPVQARTPVAARMRHADYGQHWGEGAARCFSIVGDFLDEDQGVRLMPVPESFMCPIAQAIMVDPVAAVDGNIYERDYIERWFRQRRQDRKSPTSPVTGLELTSTTLMPLAALQRAIEAYLAHRPELRQVPTAGRSFEEAAQVLQRDLLEKQSLQASAQESARLREDEIRRLMETNEGLQKALHEAEVSSARLAALLSRSRERLRRAQHRIRVLENPSAHDKVATEAPTSSDGEDIPVVLPPVCTRIESCASSPSCQPTVSTAGGCVASSVPRVGKAILEPCLPRTPQHAGATGVARGGKRKEISRQGNGNKVLLCASMPKRRCCALALELDALSAASLVLLALILCLGVASHVWKSGAREDRASDIAAIQAISVDSIPGASVASDIAEQGPGDFAAALEVTVVDSSPSFSAATPPASGADAASAAAAAAVVAASSAMASTARRKERRATKKERIRDRGASSGNAAKSSVAKGGIAKRHVGSAEEAAIRIQIDRLRQGTLNDKRDAAVSLWNIAVGNSMVQEAIEQAGAVPPLVELLSDPEASPDVHEAAVAVLGALAANSAESRVTMAKAGAIPLLVKILKYDQAGARVVAARALWGLAAHVPNQLAIVEAGAIGPLVKLLDDNLSHVRITAAAALCGLASDHKDNQDKIAEAGAIPPLVRLLREEEAGARVAAAAALRNLAISDSDHQEAAVTAGVIKPLVELLRDDKADAQEDAAFLLANLAANNANHQNWIAKAGAVKPLIALLWRQASEVREAACLVLRNLAGDNAPNARAIMQAGAIEPLSGLLADTRPPVRKQAAWALWNLAVANPEHLGLLSDAGSIEPMVQIIGADSHAAQESLAATLLKLAERHGISVTVG
eukprot:TRINITY_DN57403_c0_g1_i1.p1 TRINITY_DN57403_c0_g1~~TRINITY_DN57403_c0_g1_i1.p1  ORF type:complete len:902 (+),score=161.87 TRINITY_DN57403_c0_g1_i1:57-2708(+)